MSDGLIPYGRMSLNGEIIRLMHTESGKAVMIIEASAIENGTVLILRDHPEEVYVLPRNEEVSE